MAKLNSDTTILRDRALGHLLEAQRLLEELTNDPEFEEGSPEGEALFHLEGAIGMLSPDDDMPWDDKTADRAPPKLTLVSGKEASRG